MIATKLLATCKDRFVCIFSTGKDQNSNRGSLFATPLYSVFVFYFHLPIMSLNTAVAVSARLSSCYTLKHIYRHSLCCSAVSPLINTNTNVSFVTLSLSRGWKSPDLSAPRLICPSIYHWSHSCACCRHTLYPSAPQLSCWLSSHIKTLAGSCVVTGWSTVVSVSEWDQWELLKAHLPSQPHPCFLEKRRA